jgi:hypothetical protein
MNLRRSLECSGKSNGRADLHEPLDRLPNLMSRMRRSVTTITESKKAIEFDLPLPAECWIRYLLPAPLSRTSASALQRTNALSSAAIICRKKSENAGMR